MSVGAAVTLATACSSTSGDDPAGPNNASSGGGADATTVGDGNGPPNGDPPDGNPPNGPDGEAPDAYVPPPTIAEFGLDQRPPNTTCVAPARPPSTAPIRLERVYSGVNLQETMMMAQPPGDSSRWYVSSRTGKLVTFPAASPPAQPTVVADLAALAGRPVEAVIEGGFLSFAFHPQFATNGRVYVSWTTTDGGGPASEIGYLTSTNGGSSFTSYTKVLSFNRTRFEHCGGGLVFDKQGMLLAGFGDMANDTHGQRPLGFSSRILRLDVDNPANGKPYGIPADNPYAGGGAEPPEVFAKGVRNPFKLTVDRQTGEIWEGEVGQDTTEEINKIVKGGNYGWPCREGAHDYKANDAWLCPSKEGLIDPVLEHSHNTGGRSITGGYVYRGAAVPAFQGKYLYADFIKNELWYATPDANGKATSTQVIEAPAIEYTSFAEDVAGELYATTLLKNEIYKVVPAGPKPPSTFPERLSQTGCVDAANPRRFAAGVIPFSVNSPLWSDGAAKQRGMALPDGKTITVKADGDFDLPIGTVLIKTFALGGKAVETRLFVRHEDGEWGGYTYEWNDDQRDAVLLQAAKTKTVGSQSWFFPSRTDCFVCHTEGAGRSLGPELGQLNGESVYPATNRQSNQLKTLEHIGVFAAPLGKPVDQLVKFADPSGTAPVEARARAYLHSNCSGCHRPNGGAAWAPMDFRHSVSFADTKTCNQESGIGATLGIDGAKILVPGKPEQSLMSVRMHRLDARRMPPLGRSIVDETGVKVIDDWIRAATCP